MPPITEMLVWLPAMPRTLRPIADELVDHADARGYNRFKYS